MHIVHLFRYCWLCEAFEITGLSNLLLAASQGLVHVLFGEILHSCWSSTHSHNKLLVQFSWDKFHKSCIGSFVAGHKYSWCTTRLLPSLQQSWLFTCNWAKSIFSGTYHCGRVVGCHGGDRWQLCACAKGSASWLFLRFLRGFKIEQLFTCTATKFSTLCFTFHLEGILLLLKEMTEKHSIILDCRSLQIGSFRYVRITWLWANLLKRDHTSSMVWQIMRLHLV